MFGFLKGRLVFVRLCMIAASIALVGFGVLTLYAIGHPADPSPTASTAGLTGYWKKQLVFACVAAVGFLLANLIHYRRLGSLSYWMFGLILVLLAVLIADKFVNIPLVVMRNGARRWIRVGTSSRYILAQPSEFCKVVYILALAWYLRYRSNYDSLRALLGPFLLTLLPMALILAEPDLGTVMLMMPILFAMLFVAGARVKHFLLVVLMALLVSPLLWHKMHSYQRRRISAVLLQNSTVRQKAQEHPNIARLLVGEKFSAKKWQRDWGFNLIRSKFAIASGGLKGNGFRSGEFITYNWLPERHNDFIFSSIAHQWGFAGCLVLFGLYAVIIICGLEIAANNTDPFGRLITIGIMTMFIVEVFVNVAMTMGLMPITGLTLPLVSYGGSSLLVSIVAVGLLNNVGRCRPFSVAPKAFEE
jgi:cell division protein FtsW (lipid II flippase)